MKKTLLYSLAVLASISLASCAGDYDDWANPQTNEQEAAASKYDVTFAAGPEAEGSMADEDGIINLVTVSSTNANVDGFTLKELKINGEEINGEINGNNIQVNAADLEKLVCDQNQSRASVARDLKVESQVSVNLTSGDAVAISTIGETIGKFTPAATPAIDEAGYYMLGQVNDNAWNPTSPVWMNKISDGVYQLMVTTTADSNWFKFYAGSDFVSDDWNSINKGALGCLVNGSTDATGYIIYNGDKWGELQTPVIPGAGTWLVTLDMNNLTYSVGKPVLYMAGDCNGWKQDDVLTSTDGIHFTGYMYLNQNGFKFCSQQDWYGTNYGEEFSTAGDASDIKMSQAPGYYKVEVDLDTKNYALYAITSISMIGEATPGGWTADTDLTYNAAERCWEIKDVHLDAKELKFRSNYSWNDPDPNWGGTLDALVQKGANIKVDEAGTYDVKLYAWADGYAKCELIKK